jgi:F0F1-type ATP synthase assembly protein I
MPDDEPRLPRYRRPELPFERKATPLGRAGYWSAIGLEFGLAVVLFFLGGQALDEKLRTTPWLAVVGTMVGVAVGTYLMVRPLLREASRRKPPDGDADQSHE